MTGIPTHKAVQQSDFGIFAKEVSPFSPNRTINYVHRDDYYILGVVKSGSCHVSIDFKEYVFSAGDVVCTQPNQVHHIIDTGNADVLLLFIDGVFIDTPTKQIIAEYVLSPVPFKINDIQYTDLGQLFSMILRRMNRRHIEITLALKALFSEEKQLNRSVSYYAEALHISPVYLNEVVKNVTGESVSKYIQNELILRAKRMLVYTSLNVREISIDLGIEDYAYFTRLFTKAVGVNPTSYRKKYLE